MLLNNEQTKQVERERGTGRVVTGIAAGSVVVGFLGVAMGLLARFAPDEAMVVIVSTCGIALLSGMIILAISNPIYKSKKDLLMEKNKALHAAYLLDKRFSEIDQIIDTLEKHVDKQKNVADIIESARHAVKEKVERIDSTISVVKSAA